MFIRKNNMDCYCSGTLVFLFTYYKSKSSNKCLKEKTYGCLALREVCMLIVDSACRFF